jgi:hypothetical protein
MLTYADFKAAQPDRREFVQNPKTYKTLNKITKKEALFVNLLRFFVVKT